MNRQERKKKSITLDGSTGLSCIAALGGGKYAISGGIHTSFNFQQGSMKVYVVSLPAQNVPAAVIDSIPVPEYPHDEWHGCAPRKVAYITYKLI